MVVILWSHSSHSWPRDWVSHLTSLLLASASLLPPARISNLDILLLSLPQINLHDWVTGSAVMWSDVSQLACHKPKIPHICRPDHEAIDASVVVSSHIGNVWFASGTTSWWGYLHVLGTTTGFDRKPEIDWSSKSGYVWHIQGKDGHRSPAHACSNGPRHDKQNHVSDRCFWCICTAPNLHGDPPFSKWGPDGDPNFSEMGTKWGPSPAEWGPKKRMFAKLIETS